jgi:pimeloyl-ACP methyl ester carboxylesterase
MSHLEFVSFLSTDMLKLPGLLYKPAVTTKRAAIWLHGMGDTSVFYSPERINTLATALNDRGIAFFAFNNRGAYTTKSLRILDETVPEEDRYYQGGTYYEKIADAIKDIDGAVGFLKSRGFAEFSMIGHSTGANKIAVYDALSKNNPFSNYVLAGPGDDSGMYYAELGKKKFWAALDYARRAIAAGKPLQIMPQYSGMYPFSTQAAADIMDPDGDYNTFPYYESTHERLGHKPLFQEYKQINIPTLVIFGENDEYTYTAGGTRPALDLFIRNTSNAMLKKHDFMTVPDADHSFHGAEDAFAAKVADWLCND